MDPIIDALLRVALALLVAAIVAHWFTAGLDEVTTPYDSGVDSVSQGP